MLIYNDKAQREGFLQRFKNKRLYQAMDIEQAWDWYYTTQALKVYNQNFKKLLSLKAYDVDSTMRVFEGQMELKNHLVHDFSLYYEENEPTPVLIVNYQFPFE